MHFVCKNGVKLAELQGEHDSVTCIIDPMHECIVAPVIRAFTLSFKSAAMG